MLVNVGYREIREDHQEHENIVDAQRFLDQVTGKKLESFFGAPVVVDADIENERQGDPYQAPSQRLAQRNLVSLAMKDPEIDGEHRQNEQVEKNPKERTVHRGINSPKSDWT